MPIENSISRPFFYTFLILLISLSFAPLAFSQTSAISDSEYFDTVIDSNLYIVRPGDQFRIDIWDGSSAPVTVTVTPEGFVLIEEIGRMKVGGMTLTEAKRDLGQLLNRYYSGLDCSISLVGIRPVKIQIIGGVENPGLYSGYVSQRVSDIIKKAGGLKRGASQRNIHLITGKNKHSVDLLRFDRTGDLYSNPYLYSGNIIQIPMVFDSSGFVHISGEVTNPGSFEYRIGDNLGSIIDLASGFSGLQGDSIYIFRKINDSIQTIALTPGHAGFEIFPSDKIVINRADKNIDPDYYTIIGEIDKPGRYPYRENLNLEAVLAISGSATPKADMYSLTIYRKAKSFIDKNTSGISAATSVNSLSFSDGYEPISLEMKSYHPNRHAEINIYPGDSIVVPSLTGSFGVYGMVSRPGMVEYEKPISARTLINQSGGYSDGADKGVVQVIRKTSGIQITSRPNIDVFDGDIVVVPALKERKSFWDKIKDISIILGGLGLTYLAIDNIVD